MRCVFVAQGMGVIEWFDASVVRSCGFQYLQDPTLLHATHPAQDKNPFAIFQHNAESPLRSIYLNMFGAGGNQRGFGGHGSFSGGFSNESAQGKGFANPNPQTTGFGAGRASSGFGQGSGAKRGFGAGPAAARNNNQGFGTSATRGFGANATGGFGNNSGFGSGKQTSGFGKSSKGRSNTSQGNANFGQGFGSPSSSSRSGGGNKNQRGFGGNLNQTGFGGNNKARTGFGGNNITQTGFGGNSKGQTGFGGNNKTQTGFGGNNKAQTGFGGNNKAQTGFGGNNKAQTGFGGNSKSQTGFGSNNKTQTGFGGNNKSKTGFGGSKSQTGKNVGFGNQHSTAISSGFGGNTHNGAAFGAVKGSGEKSGFGSGVKGKNNNTGFGAGAASQTSGFGQKRGKQAGFAEAGFGDSSMKRNSQRKQSTESGFGSGAKKSAGGFGAGAGGGFVNQSQDDFSSQDSNPSVSGNKTQQPHAFGAGVVNRPGSFRGSGDDSGIGNRLSKQGKPNFGFGGGNESRGFGGDNENSTSEQPRKRQNYNKDDAPSRRFPPTDRDLYVRVTGEPVDDDALYEYFGQFGVVDRAKSLQNKMCGFITMAKLEEAQVIVDQGTHEYDGTTFQVTFNKKSRKAQQEQDQQPKQQTGHQTENEKALKKAAMKAKIEELKKKISMKKKMQQQTFQNVEPEGDEDEEDERAAEARKKQERANRFKSKPLPSPMGSGAPKFIGGPAPGAPKFIGGPASGAPKFIGGPGSAAPKEKRDGHASPRFKASPRLTTQATKRPDVSSERREGFLVGTCMKMCPQSEFEKRYNENSVHLLERTHPELPDLGEAEDIMVKSFMRSSAGIKLDIPEIVRPEAVLDSTLEYLWREIIDHPEKGTDPRFRDSRLYKAGDGETPTIPFVFAFLQDRTRSIRKDFSLQGYMDENGPLSERAVRVIEQCARFHIMVDQMLCQATKDEGHDETLNRQEANNCLKALNGLYSRARARVIAGSSTFSKLLENEAEFRAYYILLQGTDAFTVANFLKKLPRDIIDSAWIQMAISIMKSARSLNYMRFFRILKSNKVPYLVGCLMHGMFISFWRKCLVMLNNSAARNGDNVYTYQEICKLFCFEDLDHAKEFCNYIGLQTQDGIHVEFGRIRSLPQPESRFKRRVSRLIELKRNPIPSGNQSRLPPRREIVEGTDIGRQYLAHGSLGNLPTPAISETPLPAEPEPPKPVPPPSLKVEKETPKVPRPPIKPVPTKPEPQVSSVPTVSPVTPVFENPKKSREPDVKEVGAPTPTTLQRQLSAEQRLNEERLRQQKQAEERRKRQQEIQRQEKLAKEKRAQEEEERRRVQLEAERNEKAKLVELEKRRKLAIIENEKREERARLLAERSRERAECMQMMFDDSLSRAAEDSYRKFCKQRRALMAIWWRQLKKRINIISQAKARINSFKTSLLPQLGDGAFVSVKRPKRRRSSTPRVQGDTSCWQDSQVQNSLDACWTTPRYDVMWKPLELDFSMIRRYLDIDRLSEQIVTLKVLVVLGDAGGAKETWWTKEWIKAKLSQAGCSEQYLGFFSVPETVKSKITICIKAVETQDIPDSELAGVDSVLFLVPHPADNDLDWETRAKRLHEIVSRTQASATILMAPQTNAAGQDDAEDIRAVIDLMGLVDMSANIVPLSIRAVDPKDMSSYEVDALLKWLLTSERVRSEILPCNVFQKEWRCAILECAPELSNAERETCFSNVAVAPEVLKVWFVECVASILSPVSPRRIYLEFNQEPLGGNHQVLSRLNEYSLKTSIEGICKTKRDQASGKTFEFFSVSDYISRYTSDVSYEDSSNLDVVRNWMDRYNGAVDRLISRTKAFTLIKWPAREFLSLYGLPPNWNDPAQVDLLCNALQEHKVAVPSGGLSFVDFLTELVAMNGAGRRTVLEQLVSIIGTERFRSLGELNSAERAAVLKLVIGWICEYKCYITDTGNDQLVCDLTSLSEQAELQDQCFQDLLDFVSSEELRVADDGPSPKRLRADSMNLDSDHTIDEMDGAPPQIPPALESELKTEKNKSARFESELESLVCHVPTAVLELATAHLNPSNTRSEPCSYSNELSEMRHFERRLEYLYKSG